MNGRRKSPLVIYEKISPNKTIPRNKPISRLTPHCVAGNLSVESTLSLTSFQSGGGVSATYAIGSDGRIGMGVSEKDRPWTSSSGINDHQAITFEIANDSGGPDWHMSDAAINMFLEMAIDICRFYGWSKVNYQNKPTSVSGLDSVEKWIKTWAKPDEMLITLHNWYTSTICPGPYFTRQLPWLVKEMNRRLQSSTYIPEAFVGEGNTPIFKSYLVKIAATILNVRSGPGTNHKIVTTLYNDKNVYTIVGEERGPGATKWGKLKSGIGWISLDYISKV